MAADYQRSSLFDLRRLSSIQIRVAGILLVSLLAVLAAFVKIVIGLAAHKGWDWVGFFQDVAQFAVIAAVVAAVTAGIAALAVRRQHEFLIFRSLAVVLIAFYGPSTAIFRVSPSDTKERRAEFLETALDLVDQVLRTLPELAQWLQEFVAKYGKAAEPRLSSVIPEVDAALAQLASAQESTLALISSMLWSEFHRIITASHDLLNLRGQRRTLLSYLADDLAQITATESKLAAGAAAVRDSVVAYLALMQQTDAAIESDFILRNTNSDLWISTAPTGKTYLVTQASLSGVSDRVAYLLAFCDERLRDTSDIELRRVATGLAPSFRALAAEFWAANDLAMLYRSLVEEALRVGPASIGAVAPQGR